MVDTLGTTQSDWVKLTDVTANTTAPNPGSFANLSSRPTTSASTGVFVLPDSGDLPGLNNISLKFYGERDPEPPDPEDDPNYAEAFIWLLNRDSQTPSDVYCGVYVGKLRIKLGDTPGSGGTYTSAQRFACDILAEDDRSLQPPGMRVVANDTNRGIATITFDTLGAHIVVVRLRLGNALANIGLAYRAF